MVHFDRFRALVLEPFSQGKANIQSGVNKIVIDRVTGEWVQDLGVCESICHIAVGILLLIPVINTIVFLILARKDSSFVFPIFHLELRTNEPTFWTRMLRKRMNEQRERRDERRDERDARIRREFMRVAQNMFQQLQWRIDIEQPQGEVPALELDA